MLWHRQVFLFFFFLFFFAIKNIRNKNVLYFMNNISYIEGLQHRLSVVNFAMSLKRYAMWLFKFGDNYLAFFHHMYFTCPFYEVLHDKNFEMLIMTFQ